MAEIGSLGARNYEMTFPSQQQQFAAQAPMAQPAPVEVPEYSSDPLAVREKLTSDYFNNMGQLRAFAKDMSAKGIDPFQPDYTQEGGGLAFQTMQKLQANLMYAANALGNEFKAETQMRPYLAQGATMLAPNTDTQGLYAQDPNNYIPTRLPAGVEEANVRMRQETNDPQSQNRANQAIQQQIASLDQQVAQGLMRPEEAEYYKQQLVPNQWRTQPFAPKSPRSGLTEEDFAGRAELIKRMKRGVVTSDPTVLNTLKLVPGVEDVEYVNTGDKVGIQVYMRGQGQPAFIDATSGEGEINAMLNRIEGQKNIPNEAVPTFDTRVEIPSSNARIMIDDAKAKVKQFDEATVSKLQELAAQRQLITPDGGVISSVEIDEPYFWGKTKLKITYHPVENNKISYNKTREKELTDPAEIDSYLETNANVIAPAFGGGFVTEESLGLTPPAPTSGKSIKRADIATKAAASGYTPEEYAQLLQQKGIQIVD